TLTHLRARQYDPTTSAFTTTDPLPGLGGTTTLNNPYHYTNNNPLNLIDPTGMRPGDQPYLLAGVLVVPAGIALPSVGSLIAGAVAAAGATAAGTAALIVGTAAAGFAVGYYVVGPALERPIDWVYDTFFAPDWDEITRCGNEFVAGRYTTECAAQIPNLNWERIHNNTNQPKHRPLPIPPPTTTTTDRCPTSAPQTDPRCDEQRGTIQIQGTGLSEEVTWSWAQATPPTAAEGLAQLDALVAQLPRRDLRQVDQAVEAAKRKIQSCTPGGCPPLSWTRSNRGVRGSVARVDIAIYTGLAFT
ncbi:MAG: RHS repeat-associated core domain-containing protein, partial [Microthrixaceae bacterium]